MKPRHIDIYLLLVIGVIFLMVGVGIGATWDEDHPDTRPSVTVDQDLQQIIRWQHHDRYLLCQIADATSVDGLPQPCLDDEGRPLR
jgi:hypothetical protein